MYLDVEVVNNYMEKFYHTMDGEFNGRKEVSRGGFYEAVDDVGFVIENIGSGFQKSREEQLCASKSEEASLFAKIHNSSEGKFTIFAIVEEPDVLIENVSYDFQIIEEVRYNMEDRESIMMESVRTVVVPNRAVHHVNEVYGVEGKQIDKTLAKVVKSGLEDLISSGNYPSTDEIVNRYYNAMSEQVKQHVKKEDVRRKLTLGG